VPDTDDLRAQLAVTEETLGAVHVLALKGELDLSTVSSVAPRIEELIAADTHGICVDLLELTFMDSTGLATMLGALRDIRRRGGRLALACTNPTVLRLFEITGTDETFEIFPTRDEAVARAAEPSPG
jgi:anti-sigma B factor antagonist